MMLFTSSYLIYFFLQKEKRCYFRPQSFKSMSLEKIKYAHILHVLKSTFKFLFLHKPIEKVVKQRASINPLLRFNYLQLAPFANNLFSFSVSLKGQMRKRVGRGVSV